ncbi:hypothetical protein I3843_09G215600 [Carya illinoinensis]|nr:hypothetical protein I3843_09G215600 [Carya illinoinensis]
MATMRATTAVPSPSPIPTGKGSYSAANETFIKHLKNSLQPPKLEFPVRTHHLVPAEIHIRSLVSRGRGSVDRLLRSAGEFGACRISGHGISSEELRSLVEEAEGVFRNSCFVERKGGNREEIALTPTQHWEGEFTYPKFSQIMENVASKLDAVAKQLIQVLTENADDKKFWKVMQDQKEVVAVTLYRHHHNNDLLEEQDPIPVPLPNNQRNDKSYGDDHDHALSFHLPMEQCQFYIQSKRGLLSFKEGPDRIVVIIGKQLEEWSQQGEFKCVSGDNTNIIHQDGGLQGTQPFYTLELKYSSN